MKLKKSPFPWAETSATAIPCKGYQHNTPDNSDYDCGYAHAPECERCVCSERAAKGGQALAFRLRRGESHSTVAGPGHSIGGSHYFELNK